MIPSMFRVKAFTEELSDTFSLSLTPADGSACENFAPGQFNMLYAFGGGEVPISLSGSPARSQEWIHTIRAVGPATQLLGKLQAGDSVGVRGPFGKGWPLELARGKDLVVVAGGLGLAPLRPVILAYLAGDSGIRSLTLLYGARSPDDILYREEIPAWKKHARVRITVDNASPGWHGRVGVVTMLMANAKLKPGNSLAFLCGPEVMMRFALQELLVRGFTEDSLYLSMERNMKCATGHCGHCQWGPAFICKDGPVFNYQQVKKWFQIREL